MGWLSCCRRKSQQRVRSEGSSDHAVKVEVEQAQEKSGEASCARGLLQAAPAEESNDFRLTRGGAFGRALESSTLAVIRGRYFLDCLDRGEPFAHRAAIEGGAPHAIFAGKEAAELWYQHGHRFLLVVSYCWLSREHPDPQMFYLPYLKAVIEGMKHKYSREDAQMQEFGFDGIEDIGVILDYASFYQEPRTEEQKRSFVECLSMVNVPYGHKDVTAVKLVTVPMAEKRTYDDRGWTKFESDVIDSKPSAEKLGRFNILTCDSPTTTSLEELANCQRRPPVTPSRFQAEMEERRQRAAGKGVNLFTNGKDQQFLEVKYAETFTKMARSTTKLNLDSKNIGDAGVRQLCEALPHFKQLEVLYLFNNQITDQGAESLAEALPHVEQLKALGLFRNQIADAGAKSLVGALAAGAAPNLRSLDLRLNAVGDDGAHAIAEALPQIEQLKELFLISNRITDAGAKSLVEALRHTRQLDKLDLSANQITDCCAKSLAEVVEGRRDLKLLL